MSTFTGQQVEQLVAMSRRYGADPWFVLAGGGNTSVKQGNRLLVKASGFSMATIDENGFVELDRDKLSQILRAPVSEDATQREAQVKEATLASRIHPEKGQRPSVECILHHLFPQTFVAHTHSTLVNMITCLVGGEALASKLFGDEVLWLPYVDPGLILARTLEEHVKAWKSKTGKSAPSVVFMANHGLIVAGETPVEIEQTTARIIDKIRKHLASVNRPNAFGAVLAADPQASRSLIETIAPALRGLLSAGNALKIVSFDDSLDAIELVGGDAGREIATRGPLTPDQIVYCKSFPLWFELKTGESPAELVTRLREGLRAHETEKRFLPNIVLVKGVGLFAAGNDLNAAETARKVYLDAIRVMAGAEKLGGVNALNKTQYRFIEDWEVEAYRQKVSLGSGSIGRAAGKVALVTGAAQGFGFEIAGDLVAQGAHVILTDVNEEGVQRAAKQIGARALAVRIDVTSGVSVAEAIHQSVRRCGGIDLFVSNAGVLKAGSVKTQPEKDFNFVTAVNYTGYFNCVQKVAPVMAIQHLARPDMWSDIVQINSKSGLQGSNKNGAYAGSKFGGIGLTQSFALELVEDGVKVNSICPGNFFDGPLWSDPENGLFAQYLRSGKVPGAKSIADVKKFYESKVPMARGCTTADVTKAIYYLMDQQYETGQALPVTGGQVMLA